jgi:Ca-activated chloride channel family protein
MSEDSPQSAPTSLVGLIDRLAEPAEPAPIPFTPETAGWTVLAALLALALLWLAVRAARRWRANAYRRAALRALDAAGDDPVKIAAILRRTALAAYPRSEVAALTGADWLRFLDATGGEGGFTDGPGATLAAAPYAPAGDASSVGLAPLARRWVHGHRLPDGEGGRT